VRRFLPELIDLVWNRKINPGKVFDLILPLEEVARWTSAARSRRCCVRKSTRPQWGTWSKDQLHRIAEADDLHIGRSARTV
jgi:hypothetical protein